MIAACRCRVVVMHFLACSDYSLCMSADVSGQVACTYLVIKDF